MDYTKAFHEEVALVAKIAPASYDAETNLTAFVDAKLYQKIVFVIHTGVIGGNIDVDIEQATASDGTPKSVDSNAKDITIDGTTGDNKVYVIEVRLDELDVNNGYRYVNIELTPAAAGIFGVQVYGLQRRYAPVSNGGFDSVTTA